MAGMRVNQVASSMPSLTAAGPPFKHTGSRSPLHYAASMGHVDVVRELLSHPAPPPAGAEMRWPNNDSTRCGCFPIAREATRHTMVPRMTGWLGC